LQVMYCFNAEPLQVSRAYRFERFSGFVSDKQFQDLQLLILQLLILPNVKWSVWR